MQAFDKRKRIAADYIRFSEKLPCWRLRCYTSLHVESVCPVAEESRQVQNDPAKDNSENTSPDLQRMIVLITEVTAAARTLYELYPDQSAVEPLYRYMDEALREVSDELARADAWNSPGPTSTEATAECAPGA
jgi:hypothetical protein